MASSLGASLDALAAADRWTYRASRQSAAEPAAWSAIALATQGRIDSAAGAANWLASQQQPGGSLGVAAKQEEPRWTTSLALLAWCVLDGLTGKSVYSDPIQRAATWCLTDRGKAGQRSPQIGHDPTLIGWSWAANTATWLEPTCYSVLALTAAGYADHPRVAEGRRVILDRLLPDGGANYGNTIVLGQPLLAHVAPTGVALVALAGQEQASQRVARSIELLVAHVGPETTPISLAWGLLGLTAHDRRPEQADAWIQSALAHGSDMQLAAYERALLLLAARPTVDWLPSLALHAIPEETRP